MPVAQTTAGPIEYEDTGGTGAPLVLLHGLLMDGAVWREVVDALANDGIRCVRPVLPFGAHRMPMRPDADLSLHGLCRIVAEFLEVLDLRDVTLCFNDWGAPR